jgi:hypothetical protein
MDLLQPLRAGRASGEACRADRAGGGPRLALAGPPGIMLLGWNGYAGAPGLREHQDAGQAAEADAAGGYAVERQVLYGDPPDERNYWIVWAIWDRRVKAFLDMLFASREEAERHVARLRTGQERGG